MRFLHLFLMSVLFFTFCNSKNRGDSKVEPSNEIAKDSIKIVIIDSSQIDSNALGLIFSPIGNYAQLKQKNGTLKRQFKDSSDSKKKEVFENYLLNDLIPHWYKTKWDFNGYTDIPNQGVVACGYFVSTVLKHAGCNLNRYTIAQQNPLNEAKTYALRDSVEIFNVDSRQLQTIFIQNNVEGVYFVGLDFHVGFLLFRDKELYFIHSNYINSEGVKIEKTIYSEAFNAASSYRISKISTNPKFIDYWMKSKEIITIKK